MALKPFDFEKETSEPLNQAKGETFLPLVFEKLRSKDHRQLRFRGKDRSQTASTRPLISPRGGVLWNL
jgi:hypothetical protein